jgi:hypothetical protein
VLSFQNSKKKQTFRKWITDLMSKRTKKQMKSLKVILVKVLMSSTGPKKHFEFDSKINEEIISKERIRPDEESKKIFKDMFPTNVLSKESIKMIERDLDFTKKNGS